MPKADKPARAAILSAADRAAFADLADGFPFAHRRMADVPFLAHVWEEGPLGPLGLPAATCVRCARARFAGGYDRCLADPRAPLPRRAL